MPRFGPAFTKGLGPTSAKRFRALPSISAPTPAPTPQAAPSPLVLVNADNWTTGGNPANFKFNQTELAVGDELRLQTDRVSNLFPTARGATNDETLTVIEDEGGQRMLTTGIFPFTILTNATNTAAGAFWARMRRKDVSTGLWSDWSNVWTDTLGAPAALDPVTLDPTAKNGEATLSNGNLTISSPSGYGDIGSRSTHTRNTGLRYLEVTFTAGGSIANIGFGTAAHVASSYNSPGRNNSEGTSWMIASGEYWFANTLINTNNLSGSYVAPAGYASGQTMGLLADLDNNLMYVRLPSGAWVPGQNPTQAVVANRNGFPLPNAALHAYVGMTHIGSGTINFGASAFVHGLPAGAAAFAAT